MKRNTNLVNLSSEHHDGLIIALRIKKALAKLNDYQVILQYTLRVWPTLKHHFMQEETSFLSFSQIDPNHAHVKRMLDEHIQFEKIMENLSLNSNQLKEHLFEFAELLKNHIRFEERVLFPYIEEILSKDELTQIGEQLKSSHQPLCVSWSYNFWD